jgi:translocator protein
MSVSTSGTRMNEEFGVRLQTNPTTTTSTTIDRSIGTSIESPTRTDVVPLTPTQRHMKYSNTELRGIKYVNLVAYIANVVVVYGIGATGWSNLPTNAEISEKYSTLVTPVGWAFSIWGIIFMMQLLWVLQQFYGYLPENHVVAIITVRCNYVLVVIAQIAWTFCFANELLEISLCMMILILYNLSVIVIALGRLEPPSPATMSLNSRSRPCFTHTVTYFLTEFPFAVHFGWILAATIVNANIVLMSLNADYEIKYYAAFGSLLFLLFCTLLLLWFYGAITVPLVITWALFGIYTELRSPNDMIAATYTPGQIQTVQYGALGGIVLLVLILFARGIRKFFHYQHNAPTSNRDESVYFRANH